MLRRRLIDAIDLGDWLLGHAAPTDRPALLGFFFHSLFEDAREIGSGVMDPQEGLTRAGLERFITTFLDHGYEFVTVDRVLAGLPAGGRHVLLTFDDGYANNLRLPEVLRAYDVPATVFISTAHVERQQAFWWDVVARRRGGRAGPAAIAREVAWLKTQRHDEIQAYLTNELGARSLRPVGELDRPLTAAELASLGADPLITIGNHTADHALLTNEPAPEVERQIARAQSYLEQLLGQAPLAISYPGGEFDSVAIAAARRCGLRCGLTSEPERNPTDGAAERLLRLGRYVVVCDERFERRLRVCRGSLQLGHRLRLSRRARRRRTAARPPS